ncbi:hypothetical protein FBU30_002961 [Linnemannia zychae]|nr:hypothetical protein FBU30_002961 [Linnemannia zychae]
MRTTTSGRAFAKSIFDLFSTLMVSLPIENHKYMFRNYPNSFTAEEAIANLGGLQFIQSNRDTDPKDPTRIITHVVTTKFELNRDMAKNLCQTFMDARLFEIASDPTKREFQNKGVYQVTAKGAHILAKFVHRNGLPVEETRHITSNATPSLVYLERQDDEDVIVMSQKQIDMVFKRFAGPEPNMSRHIHDPPSNSSSPGGRDRVHSAPDLCNGIEVKDQQHNYDVYKHTFYGKAAVEWLLDYTTVISREEAINLCQEMVSGSYIEQIGEDRSQLFRTGNYALYHLTETGRALAGWKSLTGSRGSSINNDWMDERNISSNRNGVESKALSAQFKLAAISVARLPISIERDTRRSRDENNIVTTTTIQYSEEAGRGSMRRLSQILNDPAFQLSLSDSGAMSNYAPSSTGRDPGDVAPIPGGSPSLTSSQSMTSNTTRLNSILKNATLRDLFKNFLKQNICEENLSFYLEVIDYKSRFNSLINSARAYNPSLAGQEYPPTLRELEKQICTQAFAIFETYLVAHASREVNLPHHMRQDITAYMQAVIHNMESGPIDRQRVSPLIPGSPPAENDSEKVYKELIHMSLFDQIHDHIFRLMSTDSVPKFTRTDKYREVMMSKVNQGNVAASTASSTSPPVTGQNQGLSGGDGSVNASGSDIGSNRGQNGALSPKLGSSRNEDNLPSTFSTTAPLSSTSSANPVSSASPTASEFGGPIPRSRSSTGIGLPPKYALGFSTYVSSSSGSILGHSNHQHLWASSRLRSVSNSGPLPSSFSNGTAMSGSLSNRSSVVPLSQQVIAYPPTSETVTASTTATRQQPPQLYNSLQQRQSSGSSASLMEIYAQQQQLQQYSNQRAQLSPTQVQQMYIMRNSRSNPSLASAAATASTTTGPLGTSAVPNTPKSDTSKSDGTVLGYDATKNHSPSSSSQGGNITVLFEATSFSIDDPNHLDRVSHHNATATQTQVANPATPNTSVGSLPSLVSGSSSLSSVSSASLSASLPGTYPTGTISSNKKPSAI